MPVLLDDSMAKRTSASQPPDPDPKKPMTTTRVNKELIRKANVVAGSRDMDLFDYIESILRPVVEADYQRFIRREAEEIE